MKIHYIVLCKDILTNEKGEELLLSPLMAYTLDNLEQELKITFSFGVSDVDPENSEVHCTIKNLQSEVESINVGTINIKDLYDTIDAQYNTKNMTFKLQTNPIKFTEFGEYRLEITLQDKKQGEAITKAVDFYIKKVLGA